MSLSRDSNDRRLPLQTIGAFADAVGLSASALRSYAANGLLPPVEVEERTGYRYYDPAQQRRAIWIRRLREAGLGLDRIRAVFDDEVDAAEGALRDWIAGIRHDADIAEALAEDLLSDLRAGLRARYERRTTAGFDAAVLAAAIRQTMRAGSADEPDLEGVLIEIGEEIVVIGATDRSLLIARAAVPASTAGPPARAMLSPRPALAWLQHRRAVSLLVDDPVTFESRSATAAVSLHDPESDERLPLPQRTDRFPDLRTLLDQASAAATRVSFARRDLHRLTARADGRDALLRTDASAASLSSAGIVIEGSAIGEPASMRLTVRSLARIVDAATGDELLCDLHGPDRPMRWRTPSQPDFAALTMPLDG